MKRYLGIFLICILMAACSQKGSQQQRGNSGDASPRAEMTVKYATGFSVRDSSGVRLLDIGASDHFALVRSDDAAVPSGYQKVRVPISSTICMTALQLSNFTALDAHDVVKGITGTRTSYKG